MQHSIRLTPFHASLQTLINIDYSLENNTLLVNFDVSHTDNIDWNSLVSKGLRAEAERADYLWESTCLEIFLQPVTNVHNFSESEDARNDTYVEINVSPNGKWNAYHFDRYRSPNTMPPRRLALSANDINLMVTAPKPSQRSISLNLSEIGNVLVPSLSTSEVTSWRGNICVITQTKENKKIEGFYAVTHADPADFHDTSQWFEFIEST